MKIKNLYSILNKNRLKSSFKSLLLLNKRKN